MVFKFINLFFIKNKMSCTSCDQLNQFICAGLSEIRTSCENNFRNNPFLQGLCLDCNSRGFFNNDNYFSGISRSPSICYVFFESINTFNPEEYNNARNFMYDIFNIINSKGCKISDDRSSINYLDFQDTLLFICQNYGICDLGLNCKNTEECKSEIFEGICNNISYNSLSSSNRSLINYCSCHLDINQYVDNNIECDSLCFQNDTIKLFNSFNQVQRCNKNICTISDITINVLNSDNKVNFTQMCGNSCTNGTCSLCILKDITINQVSSAVDVNIFSNCNNTNGLNGFKCYKTVDNVITEVQCEYTGNLDTVNQNESKFGIIFIITVISVGVILFLLYLTLGLINKSNPKKYLLFEKSQESKNVSIDV